MQTTARAAGAHRATHVRSADEPCRSTPRQSVSPVGKGSTPMTNEPTCVECGFALQPDEITTHRICRSCWAGMRGDD